VIAGQRIRKDRARQIEKGKVQKGRERGEEMKFCARDVRKYNSDHAVHQRGLKSKPQKRKKS